MKHVSIVALGIALTLGVAASPTFAKEAKPAPTKLTPAVQNALVAAQKAVQAGDAATAAPQLAAAKAAIVTDDDKFMVGSIEYQLFQKTKDAALEKEALDLIADSGKGEASMRAQVLTAQSQIAYVGKDYPKAVKAAQAAIAAGAADPNLTPILVESLRQSGQITAAMQALNDAIAKQQAANQPVDPAWYQRGYAIAYSAKQNDPGYAAIRQQGIELSKKWVAAQPKSEVWHDALLLYRDSTPQDADLKLDTFRLNLAAGSLHGAGEYLEYAEAVYQRYPGEAKTVLDTGVAKGALILASSRNAAEISQIVNGKVAADKASLAASDKSARAAANGKAAQSTADAYLSYKDYAKAIDLYNVALQKGGVDPNVVNTRIGEAQYASGDKAAAKATFAKLTGPRKDLADFWTILVDHPVVG
jgi:tetratricopeptide (TPR) repeat protein